MQMCTTSIHNEALRDEQSEAIQHISAAHHTAKIAHRGSDETGS